MAKVIASTSGEQDREFDSTIKSAGEKLVVVDFTASWCGPCKAIAPTFESLAKSKSSTAVFLKVDVDQNQSLAQRYGVRAMPTFLFMRKGSILDTLRGADSRRLTSMTEQYAKGGVGSTFPGGGQTISGGGSRLSGASPASTADASLLGQLRQIPRENLLPFVVIFGYLAYVIFGRK